MRYLPLAALLILALCPSPVRAERDTFFLGTGKDKALSVSGSLVINKYAKLTAPLAAGDTSVSVDTGSGFATGDLVLLFQGTGLIPTPASGVLEPFDLSRNPVGRWELARLTSVSGTTLTLRQPLVHDYTAGVTQVIRVPEYTDVTVPAGATLTAPAWNGSTGGVVAFLASGTVTVQGRISADGLGFPGGASIRDSQLRMNCTSNDEASPAGGMKGGGVVSGGPRSGRGNLVNAGGGGNCHNAGGGGGGHGGRGGNGGWSYSGDGRRDVGGRGGASTVYSMLDHLLFGGGGGAGHINDAAVCTGGTGGGIVLIRARSLEGSGTVSANGTSAPGIGNDGGCGGGAGGSVSVRVSAGGCLSSKTTLEARGGDGSQINASQHGPGGGGGGGRLLLQGISGCLATASAGLAGKQTDATNPTYGAQPTDATRSSYAGTHETLTGNFTVPPAPTVTSPREGARVNTRRPSYSGTAPTNALVSLSRDGVEVGQVTALNGIFTFTPTADLPDGTYRLDAICQLQGVWSDRSGAVSFTMDTVAPPVPTVTSPANGSTVRTTNPVITGRAEAGARVTIFLDSRAGASVSADGAGNWSYTSPSLSQGPHVVSAQTTDAAGNTSAASAPVSFTVDSVAPAAPRVTSPASGSTVKTASPPLLGTAEPNTTVTLFLDSATTPTATVTASASGSWSHTPSPLAQGTHSVTAKATDAAGNTSAASAPVSFTVDTAAPPVPQVLSPADMTIVTSNRPLITGKAEGKSKVTVYLDDKPHGTAQANSSGDWSYTPPLPLAEGPHPVSVEATDAAGNTSARSTPISFTVDTKEPAPPVVLEPASGSALRVARPTFRGTTEARNTVSLFLDDSPTPVGTIAAEGLGWSFVLPTALPDGNHTVTATAKDMGGHVSRLSSPLSFTVDTAAPFAPELVHPAEGAQVATRKPVFSGTAEAGSTVTLFLDGSGTPWETEHADDSGGWSLIPSRELADGAHTVTATVRDVAGNTGLATLRRFVVDTQVPTGLLVLEPRSGMSATAFPTFRGKAEPWSMVTLQLDGLPLSTQADSQGRWVLPFTERLSDGLHEVVATATDLAGNTSEPCCTVTLTVDTLAPLPAILLVPGQGATLDEMAPVFRGEAEPGSQVHVYVDGRLAGVAPTDSEGLWSFALPAPLAAGTHTTSLVTVDLAGNPSAPSAPVTFTLDLEPPQEPTLTAPEAHATLDTGVITFRGTAEPGSTVIVYLDGEPVVPTTRANASGLWSLTPSQVLAEADHQAQARATDLAGNASELSSPLPFSVDTTPPGAPEVSSPKANDQVSTAYPSVIGVAEPHAWVLLFVDGSPAGRAQADGAGNWSLLSQLRLLDGEHHLDVVAEDPAGNRSRATVSVGPFWVDTTAPLAPVLRQPEDGAEVGTMTPALQGRAAPGSAVTVLLDGVESGTAIADQWGLWSLTPEQSLEEGVHLLAARALDKAGNTSTLSHFHVFTVDLTPPDVPVLETPADGTLTSGSTQAFIGTAEPTSLVFIFVDELMLGLTVADDTGRWSFLPVLPLAEGTHDVKVSSFDLAGNDSGQSEATSFTVDTTVPTDPVVRAPESGAWVGTATPTLEGTAESGGTVRIYVDGKQVATTRAGGDGHWSATCSTLPDGPHFYTVTVTDDAGLTSTASAPRLFMLDTRPPDTTLVSGPEAVFYATTVTWVFSASEPTSGAECSLDGAPFTPCTSPVTLEGLTLGAHTFEARARDLAGNVDPSPARGEWTISSAYDGAGGGLGCGGCSTPGGAPGLALLGLLGLVWHSAARGRRATRPG